MTLLRANSFAASFQQVLQHSDGRGLSVNDLLDHLADRGVAFLAVTLALPFVQPLMLPGISTPFGLTLALCGWCMMARRPLRIPGRLGAYRISHPTLDQLNRAADRLFRPLDRLFRARGLPLSHPRLQSVHGLYILSMALVLALPLPAIPFVGSNAIAAGPILLLGLGLLERDGLIIAAAYLWLVPFTAYWLFFYKAGLEFAETVWPHLEIWWRALF